MLLSRFLSDLVTLPAWSAAFGLFLVKATIVLTAGLAITRSMYRASAGARHLVWLVTLSVLLVMPALSTWAHIEIPVLPPLDATSHTARQASAAPLQLPTPPAGIGTHSVRPATAGASDVGQVSDVVPVPAAARWAVRGVSLVVAIWAAALMLILSSLVWSTLVVRRIVRRSRALEQPDWRTPLLEVADRLGLGEPPRLVASRDTRMPFACGVFTPTIVLPEECSDWPLERRRAVLLHELAHVRRRDLLGHVLGRVVCAFYWFHPLVWMAAKRLRAESERACDDLALACGTRATDYAEHLLDIVTAVRTSTTPVVALAMARRKEFEGRMLAILDPELRRSTPSRRQSAALMASLVLSAGLVGAAAPVPRAAAASSDEAAPAVRPTPPTQGAPGVTVQHPVVSPPSPARGGAMPATVVAPATGLRDEQPAASASRSEAAAASAGLPPIGIPQADQAAPDDRAVLLAKVLRTDSSAKLRRIAAWGLERYVDSPAAVDALINAVAHDADAGVREMAAWSLGSSEGHHDIADALSIALRKDADEDVRATAAWALGNVGADASSDALAAALADSSRDVRTRATWALGNVRPKQAPAALVAMLRDRDKETRQLAAWALYQIEDPAGLPALQAALRSETDEDLQLAYLRAIAVMGDKSVDALRGLIESPDARIRSAAVRALAGGHATGPWPWPWPEPRPQP